MKRSFYSITDLWASIIIEELVRLSVCDFCLSPGSRNTPLVTAVAENEQAKYIIHYDERGAGFFALGQVRATQKPMVLICTSGSAVANYLPALVEADNDNLPLIVLSADRPPELRGSGANQTIDQLHIFGNRVRSFVDMPCPDLSIEPSYVLGSIDRAVSMTRGSNAGPVHINCMFREPFTPIGEQQEFSSYVNKIEDWLKNDKSYSHQSISVTTPQLHELEKIGQQLGSAKRGIVIVGQLTSSSEYTAIENIAKSLGWPLFADVSSQLRTKQTAPAIPYSDLILSSEQFISEHQPDCILHLGGRFVSKNLQQWIELSNPPTYIQVNQYDRKIDPAHIVTTKLVADIPMFCDLVIPFITGNCCDKDWLQMFLSANQGVSTLLEMKCDNTKELTEPAIIRSIISHIPDRSALFIASSMPIRDMNSFAPTVYFDLVIGCNRGASGIDGTIASSIGFFMSTDRHAVLLIGDLAFLHDINSLYLLKNLSKQVTIVLINNNGGGIFSFLPIAERNDIFDQFFGTPHNLNFKSTAEMFALQYHSPRNMSEFVDCFDHSFDSSTPVLIECQTDRNENYIFHREIREKIIAILNNKAD